MFLETIVKIEPIEVCVKEEATDVCENEEAQETRLKEETDNVFNQEAGKIVKKEANSGLCNLYSEHQIKDELVFGPESFHRPNILSALPAAPDIQDFGRSCSVRLERIFMDPEQCTCRVGFHTYKLHHSAELLQDTKMTSITEIYQCNNCGKDFRKKSFLRKHLLIHSSESCVKNTSKSHRKFKSGRKSLLQIHHRNAGEKSFKCDHCDFKCNCKSNLLRHLTTHNTEKLFKCNQCDFKCINSVYLQAHQVIHKSVKRFKCSHCDYSCHRNDRLDIHLLKHTGGKIEKPFLCNYCDYRCSRNADLQIHHRKHTKEKPYKCSYCDFKCSQKTHLLSHERLHTGEKPFMCNHCDYKCSRKTHLQSHMMRHARKSFKCSYCNYKTKQKKYLLNHTRKHHGLQIKPEGQYEKLAIWA